MPEPGAFLIGAIPVVFATSVLAMSLFESPIEGRVPPAAIALAGAWWAGFLAAAAISAVDESGIAITGLLLAASEVAGAATIWFARSLNGGGGGGGGGGGRGGDAGPEEPGGPIVGGLPESYWRKWEQDFSPVDRGQWTVDRSA